MPKTDRSEFATRLGQFIDAANTLLADKRRDTRAMSERIRSVSPEYADALRANAAALNTPERRAEQEQLAKLQREARQRLDAMRDALPAEVERASCDSGPVFRTLAAIDCNSPPGLPDGFSWPLEKAALQAALQAMAVKLQSKLKQKTKSKKKPKPVNTPKGLTERQLEVCNLLENFTPAQVARKLGITPQAVNKHTKAARKKLEAADEPSRSVDSRKAAPLHDNIHPKRQDFRPGKR